MNCIFLSWIVVLSLSSHIYEEPIFDHPLYPVTLPLNEGYLKVSDKHTLFYATYGNPSGIPVVVCHGGPGEGCSDQWTTFFDLSRYFVVMFDQRGSIRSIPFATMEENTPQNSVLDIEKLRELLKIEKWVVFGGSWGSTLALLYGQSYPERCLGFVLKGVFLGREKDYLHLLYGMGELSPVSYQNFINFIPEEERTDLLTAYSTRILHPDPAIYMPASRAFLEFDAHCVRFIRNDESVKKILQNEKAVYCVAKHFFYYSKNRFFLRENEILEGMGKIKHLPAIIVHGKYDIVTLPENAYTLHRAWDASTLWMIPNAGHTAAEKPMASALAQALDEFSKK